MGDSTGVSWSKFSSSNHDPRHVEAVALVADFLKFLLMILTPHHQQWEFHQHKMLWLTPKGPRPFSAKKILKTAISVAKSKTIFFLKLFTSNQRILHPTSMKKCGKNFRFLTV